MGLPALNENLTNYLTIQPADYGIGNDSKRTVILLGKHVKSIIEKNPIVAAIACAAITIFSICLIVYYHKNKNKITEQKNVTSESEKAIAMFKELKLKADFGRAKIEAELVKCAEAELQLAHYYERGTGTEVNETESLKYLQLSADHGNKTALDELNKKNVKRGTEPKQYYDKDRKKYIQY